MGSGERGRVVSAGVDEPVPYVLTSRGEAATPAMVCRDCGRTYSSWGWLMAHRYSAEPAKQESGRLLDGSTRRPAKLSAAPLLKRVEARVASPPVVADSTRQRSVPTTVHAGTGVLLDEQRTSSQCGYSG